MGENTKDHNKNGAGNGSPPPNDPPPGNPPPNNPPPNKTTPVYVPDQDKRVYEDVFSGTVVLDAKITAVGRYLGKGKHSQVFQGQWVESKRDVAIKVDNRDPMNDKTWNAIQTKVKSLKALKHPNIAGLIDFIPDFENKRTFLIMEYAEGKGLNQELTDRGRPFPQGRVLDWALQLLSAMRYLHKNQRVMGDIKPSNIVVGRRDKVTLVDFSYITEISVEKGAKKADDALKRGIQDELGQYINPQEFRESVCKDIYKLGATLFELLTGSCLDEYKNNREEARKLLASQDTVRPGVVEVIMKATSPNPKDRYQSAAQMERALRELPRSDSRSQHLTYGIVIAAFAALYCLMFGIRFYTSGQNQIQRMAEMEQSVGKSSRALADGDYSGAIASALSATTRQRTDPPVSADAYKALAGALSAYDYVPGYKPLYSSSRPDLAGNPLNARLSPHERYIAVLVNDADAYPVSQRLQVLDVETGKEAASVPHIQSTTIRDFLFLNHDNSDVLLYVTDEGLFSRDLSTGRLNTWDQWDQAKETASFGLALSANGRRVACVNWTDETAYFYESGGNRLQSVSIADPEESVQERNPTMQKNYRAIMIEDHMAALNEKGEYLAVSLPNGGIRIISTNGGDSYTVLTKSTYRHFEGGFTDHFFFYAAFGTGQNGVAAECKLFDMNDMPRASTPSTDTESQSVWEPLLETEENQSIHVQADENGIYLSIGDSLFYVNTEYQIWHPLVGDTGEEILLLRHAAGRLLAITRANLVLVYREDGKWKTEISSGREYKIADLSKQYLFLANDSRALLSVLKWREAGEPVLTYYKNQTELANGSERTEEGEGTEEDEYYEHLDAHLHADGQTAMLFGSRDFRIYSSDGSYRSYPLNSPSEDEVGNPTLIYQREAAHKDDPPEECLKAIWDNKVYFYSAKTGEELKDYARERREDDAACVAGTCLIRQSGSAIEICDAKTKTVCKTMEERILTYASELDGKLILSLRTSGKEKYSLLLDEDLNVIADLPQPCEAMPGGSDNSLIFDDEQGRLLKGSFVSLEDLRTRANPQ